MQVTVDINCLVKRYPSSKVNAVDNVSLKCYEGEIVGLLGHNGAGKSTTLKCMTGILPYEGGSISINGYSLKSAPIRAKQSFGFVTDNHDVFVKMTGLQYLDFLAGAYEVDRRERKKRIEELNDVFKLGDRIFDTISDYSHGMRQKICMMGSLIHQPKVWILDEPMLGLDPSTTATVVEYMTDYVSRGNTIIFSSHNISSVSRLCTRVAILSGGKKVDDFLLSDFSTEHTGVGIEEYFTLRTNQDLVTTVTTGEQAE